MSKELFFKNVAQERPLWIETYRDETTFEISNKINGHVYRREYLSDVSERIASKIGEDVCVYHDVVLTNSKYKKQHRGFRLNTSSGIHLAATEFNKAYWRLGAAYNTLEGTGEYDLRIMSLFKKELGEMNQFRLLVATGVVEIEVMI